MIRVMTEPTSDVVETPGLGGSTTSGIDIAGEKKKSSLHYRQPGNRSSERIEKLVSSRWYVYEDSRVLDLSEDLKNENIHTVGVVNAQGKVAGLVVRQHILNLLSRQFGREVLKTENVHSIMTTCRHFHGDTSIFSVADSISHEMQAEEVAYFLVKDSNGNFEGVFSTNDMLVYLSSMTRRDIELARVIQKGIVKEYQHYAADTFEIVCSSIMAQAVGGDFYTLQKIRENQYFIALCDVSGKGIAASLVTAFLHGITHNYKFYESLTGFVTDLNRMFIKTFNLEKFVTGQFILFDPSKGELTICDTGHPFAYLYRHGKLEALADESANLPIGVTEEAVFRELKFQMQPGDTVMIVTDGILEQTDQDGNLVSLDNLSDEITKYQTLPLYRISVRLLEFFHTFRGKTPLHDDVTFLLLHYTG